jgi:hypothetical protein
MKCVFQNDQDEIQEARCTIPIDVVQKESWLCPFRGKEKKCPVNKKIHLLKSEVVLFGDSDLFLPIKGIFGRKIVDFSRILVTVSIEVDGKEKHQFTLTEIGIYAAEYRKTVKDYQSDAIKMRVNSFYGGFGSGDEFMSAVALLCGSLDLYLVKLTKIVNINDLPAFSERVKIDNEIVRMIPQIIEKLK